MPKYKYTAKDAAGKKKKGQLMAADEAALYKGRKSVFDFLSSGTKGEKEYIPSYSKAAFRVLQTAWNFAWSRCSACEGA